MKALATRNEPAAEGTDLPACRDLLAAIGDPLLLLDDQACIVHANPAARRMFGHDEHAIVGRLSTLLIPSQLRDRHLLAFRRRLRRAFPTPCRFEIRGQRADGGPLDLEACVAPVPGAGRALFSCLLRDVTAAKARERRLRASEERLSLALRGAHDAHWDWDLVTNQTHVSPRWHDMLGLPSEKACDTLDAWMDRIVPEDRLRLRKDLDEHLQGRTRRLRCEHRVLHADGTTRWILARGLAVMAPSGRPVRIAGSLTDITQSVELRERLRREALHDPLTRLPNRGFMFQRLRESLAETRRGSQQTTIAYIDLDGFKQVNDRLGHHAGDELLVMFARRLGACLRPGDVAARLGGDEFLVLVDGGLDDAVTLARALHEDLREPFRLSGRDAWTSASIGIAALTDAHRRPEDVIRDADAALYRAKAAGKARHAVFANGEAQRASRLRRAERRARRARALRQSGHAGATGARGSSDLSTAAIAAGAAAP